MIYSLLENGAFPIYEFIYYSALIIFLTHGVGHLIYYQYAILIYLICFNTKYKITSSANKLNFSLPVSVFLEPKVRLIIQTTKTIKENLFLCLVLFKYFR